MWGDRINMQMLRRLEELYPNQDEFRQGYVDGYKEGLHSRGDVSKRLILCRAFFLIRGRV